MPELKDLEEETRSPKLVIDAMQRTAGLLVAVWDDMPPEARRGVFSVLHAAMEGIDWLTKDAQAAVLSRMETPPGRKN